MQAGNRPCDRRKTSTRLGQSHRPDPLVSTIQAKTGDIGNQRPRLARRVGDHALQR